MADQLKLIGANGRDAIRDPDTGEQVYVSQIVACADYDPDFVFDPSTVVHHRNHDPWCDWGLNLAAMGKDTHEQIHALLNQ